VVVAVGSAVLAEEPSTEGIGTFGVEAGAALWFGGAVALSLRSTSARHLLLVLGAGAVGALLVAISLVLGWSGAALALAMEFGVGALAVVVIDVIVLGRVQPGLDAVGRLAPTSSLDITLERGWPPVAVRVLPADAAPPA
jgi:hypothetical protein